MLRKTLLCLIVLKMKQVVGTPTREEIMAMNQNYTEFKFPQIKAHPWAKVLPPPTLPLPLSLCWRFLMSEVPL